MANILVVHSRKGGVGKSVTAYELAFLLDAVLVDLEWDGGGVSRQWGYRHEDRVTSPLITALDRGRVPRPLKGFRKPDLVPGSPELLDARPEPDAMAEALTRWAGEWGRDWVVVDTHPGASSAAHGAMSVANVVLVPTGLRTYDLNGTEQMILDMPDYPLVIVPTLVRRVPPAAEIARLARMIEGTPVRVAPPVPFATAVETRKKRIAMTAEDPTPKSLQKVVNGYRAVAQFVKEYTAA